MNKRRPLRTMDPAAAPPTEACCPPARPEPDPPEAEREANEALARIAKALGHPARVAIVRLLLRRETCVCGEIVDALPLAQSTVSQHLKALKAAGLIRGEVEGPRVCYCIEPGQIRLLETLVSELGSEGVLRAEAPTP